MYPPIHKKQSNKYGIFLSAIIVLMIILNYRFHLSFKKSFVSSCALEYSPEKSKIRNVLVKSDYTTPFRLVRRRLPTPELKNKVIWRFHRTYEDSHSHYAPNHVHYLRLNETNFTYIDEMCLLSVFKNHVPERITIHTYYSNLSGFFWDRIKVTRGLRLILQVLPLDIPVNISTKLNNNMSVIRSYMKLDILRNYGGIILDNDVFVVNNLDRYLRYDMAIHWKGMETILSDKVGTYSKCKGKIFTCIWFKGFKRYLDLVTVGRMSAAEYATYRLLSKNSYDAHVDFKHFLIDFMSISTYVLYEKPWRYWLSADALWLMMDSITPDIEKRINEYIEQAEKERKTKTNDNSNNDVTFVQLIKDVHY